MDERKTKLQVDCYTYVEGVGFTQPDPFAQERHILRIYAMGLGWALLATMFFASVLPYYFVSLARMFDPAVRFYNNQVVINKTTYYLVKLASYLLAFTLPFLAFALLNKIPRRVIFPAAKIKPVQAVGAIGLGLGVAVAGSVCSWLFIQAVSLLGVVPVMPDMSLPREFSSAAVLLVQLVLIAPLVEEFVFRGVILGSLRRFGDGFAIVVSALLFGLIHRNMVQLPNAFLMGLVLAYAVVRTGSLWTGILMHLCNNLLAMGMSAFAQLPGGRWLTWMMMACMILAGIAALVGLLASRQTLWVKRTTGWKGLEAEKYRVFFSQPSQIICVALMLVSILQNFKRI